MKLLLLSDLHGYEPDNLPQADVLIIAGDHTARDTEEDWVNFYDWLDSLQYDKKIIIAGNHDNLIDAEILNQLHNVVYLFDSGIEYNNLKIHGSPWTLKFKNQNPECAAFSLHTEKEMKEKFDFIPKDTDILITHTPPFGILDTCYAGRVGSKALLMKIATLNLKANIFGHIHSNGREQVIEDGTIFVNAAMVDERYRLYNNPIVIDL